jgi:starch-binding outer membrane protein, SusD/RagB family
VWSYDLNREPRYYAWIAPHNSIYEVPNPVGYNAGGSITGYRYGGDMNRLLVQLRATDGQGVASGGSTRTNNYSVTGYLIKKGVSPQTAITTSGYSLSSYSWPLIRLSELYLDYAEALIEGDDGSGSNLATAKTYIDKIRTRAGIPTIDNAWSVVPGYSGGVHDKKTLRSIVRQERTVEFVFEGKRFWDLRRWGIADKYLGIPIYGMNINANDDGFFQKTQLPYTRSYPAGYWLLPIPIAEVQKDPQLVQNPGY